MAQELDTAYIEEVCGGDMEFVHEILATFLESAPELLDGIERALETDDLAALRHHSHTLKGSSRSVGANPLADIAMEIESAARNGDMSPCPPLATKARERFAVLKREIEAMSLDQAA